MSESLRIVDQLHRAYEGPAWHGPALAEIVSGVTAEMAARRPVPEAHTIWEIVAHITVWMSVCAGRLQGEEIPTLPPEQDWPPIGDSGSEAWQRALGQLADAQSKLESQVRSLSDSRLSETVMGERPYSLYAMLHGVVQHNLYHAGQISLLKKLA